MLTRRPPTPDPTDAAVSEKPAKSPLKTRDEGDEREVKPKPSCGADVLKKVAEEGRRVGAAGTGGLIERGGAD